MSRKTVKLVREGRYIAEVMVELIEDDTGWSPYLSIENARKLDDARMAADYEMVKTYIGLDQPFDVKTAYTNEFLDRSIKMTK